MDTAVASAAFAAGTTPQVVLASPQAVAAGRREGWLRLFAPDATIEDPVGGAAYRTPARRAAFWDTFIAPQRTIEFRPRRDFVGSNLVVRQVVIDTFTPISDVPLSVPTIIEYRLRGDKICALRAFWSPWLATKWFASRGRAGVTALAEHNVRIARHLGLRSLTAFGSALMPRVSADAARRPVEALLAPADNAALVERLHLEVHDTGVRPSHRPLHTAVERLGTQPRIDQLVCAGSEAAAVVVGDAGAAAVLLQFDRGQPRRVRWISTAPA